MTETLQLLQAAWPHLALLFALVVIWRVSNMSISLTYSAKTTAPEPSKHTIAVLKGERDEAREQAQLLRDELARKP